MSECTKWFESDDILMRYHDNEWCKENHDDQYQFEMLCLEGASVGLSFKTVMLKREAYQEAFHQFDIEKCAHMSDEELDKLITESTLIKNKSKIYSVRSNALIVQKIQKEYGSFDKYLWSFTNYEVIDHHSKTFEDVPTVNEIFTNMSKDMKKRGIKYVGPTITYSFMQSIGMVNDHLEDCEKR